METLQSVKNQSYTNWECLIIDDGSTDDTPQKVIEFCNDQRFKYFSRPADYPKGACACRNYGLEKSQGKYIQWLDDDDLLSKNKLEAQITILERLEEPGIFSICSWDLLWPEKSLELKNSFEENIYYNPAVFYQTLRTTKTFMPPHSFLISRELALKAGNWNPHLKINQDAEYFSRIVACSSKFISTNLCFVLYREHSGNRISIQNHHESIKSLIISWRLIHTNLLRYEIKDKKYFKWKLLLVFHKFHKENTNLLKDHYYFFKENGVDLKWGKYYVLKYQLYKLVYPWYKKKIKKKT